MSRALVALDALRLLTDGSEVDLAALLSEVVAACPIAGPWREVRIHYTSSWSREVIVRTARGDQYPGLVEVGERGWAATALGVRFGVYDTPERARDAADAALVWESWVLLD